MMIYILVISGCTSEPTFEQVYRQTYQGIVTNKAQLSKEEIQVLMNELRQQRVIETVAVNILTLPLGVIMIPPGDLSTETHKYEIELESKKTIQILNRYPGFNIGDCVTVFLSDDWEKYPPRMAYC